MTRLERCRKRSMAIRLVSEAMASKRKWIKGAIQHSGALTASANRAGMTPHEFAEKHKHDKGTTGNRARMALTLAHFNHKR